VKAGEANLCVPPTAAMNPFFWNPYQVSVRVGQNAWRAEARRRGAGFHLVGRCRATGGRSRSRELTVCGRAWVIQMPGMPLNAAQMQQLQAQQQMALVQVGSRPPLGAMGGRGRHSGGSGAWGGGRGYGSRGGGGGGRGGATTPCAAGPSAGAPPSTAFAGAPPPPPSDSDHEERQCVACDRTFKGLAAMTAHLNMHVTCGEDGCQFQASGKALKVPYPSPFCLFNLRCALTPRDQPMSTIRV
jgi:hypothetical protein